MKKLVALSKQIPLPSQQTDSHAARRFNFRAVAFHCALLSLLIFGGIVATQAQQPDPLTVTPQGNVGIGTSAPANKLSVTGNADVSGNVGIGMTAPVNKLSVAGNADVSGNLGIGTTAPSAKLDVAGSGWFRNDQNALPATAGKGVRVFYDINDSGQIFSYDYSTLKPRNLLLQSPGGNVGIGTTDPGGSKLKIENMSGNFAHFRFDASGNGGELLFLSWIDGWSIGSKTSGKNLYLNRLNKSDVLIGYGSQELVVKGDTGNVGIGTLNPTKAKLEVRGFLNQKELKFGWLNAAGATGKYDVPGPDAVNLPYSIWAERRIAAEEFNAFSDERLKNIQGRSDSALDLRTLLGIEITDYRHKDVIGKGNGTYKKVTGQQVAKVFPQAVSQAIEVVPDIYRPAPIQNGWVTLATDLKKGERVKLITEKGEEGIYEVLEVAQDRFRTDFKSEGNRVFVYGREVKDFLTVDYGAISMLNVSATQQIKKEKDEEVKALQEENATLRSQLAEQEKRLAELEGKDKARDERLAALETLLLAGDKQAPRAVSLKKVE